MVRMIRFMQLAEYCIRIIRFFTPWVVRTGMFILGLILISVISFWSGVPNTVSKIANQWLSRATNSGFPTIWDDHLYDVLSALAYMMIVCGWVFLSYLTVWVINLIF